MAEKPKFTQDTVAALACPPGRKDVLFFDRDLAGFGLRVQSNGRKTFLAQFNANGIRRREPLGAFGVLSVEEARKRAKGILGDVAKGLDPVAEKRAKVAAAAEAAAAAKQKAAETEFTFARLVDAWVAGREGSRKAGYLANAARSMKLHLPDWLTRPANSITTREAVLALDNIKATRGPVTANRTMAYARAAYSWAVRRQMVDRNPFTGVERPTTEKSRDRVLTADELAAIWRASDSMTPPYRGFVRVLMLTLQRREEVAQMRWAELSADLSTWTLPAERSKNGKAHVIHLSEAARAIIAALPRLRECPFVFAARVHKPVSAHSTAKNQLTAAIAAHRTKAGLEPADLPDWRFHDFRRAGVTALADMGFPPHVCDKILNHTAGAISGVAAVYQRAEFLPERKAALEAWAGFVTAAAEGKALAENVVPLLRTAAA